LSLMFWLPLPQWRFRCTGFAPSTGPPAMRLRGN
jgi:hypothetical protein